MEQVYQKLYVSFFKAVDGMDNGVNQQDDLNANYKVTTALSNRVGRLNSWWTEKGVDMDDRFESAMQLVRNDLVAEVKGIIL